jgi:N-acetylmuramoyl-L-alanine amidase
VDAAASSIRDEATALVVEVALSQPVPWRAYTLERPRRLVIDFLGGALRRDPRRREPRALAVTAGPIQPGWSRMVVELGEALAIETAGLDTSGPAGPRLTVRSRPSRPRTSPPPRARRPTSRGACPSR